MYLNDDETNSIVFMLRPQLTSKYRMFTDDETSPMYCD